MLVKIEKVQREEVLVVSSRQVAEDFEKRHGEVIYAIEGRACTCGGKGCEKCSGRGYQQLGILQEVSRESHLSQMFIKTEYKDTMNRPQTEYLMTRDGFTLLVMGFTGDKAFQWKLKYIEAFNEMEKELKRLYEERKQWEVEREKGVLIRHILTDTIKMKIADSANKKFMYPNYTKLIYKSIFGKTFDELKLQFGIKPKESLRDYLASEQLKEVEQMEMLVSSLIGIGMGYEEIKAFISEKYKQPQLMAVK
jgi:Rha family phage regulatory protein